MHIPSQDDPQPPPPATSSAGGSSGYSVPKRVSNGQLNASNRFSIPPPPASPSPSPAPQTPVKNPRKRRSVQNLKASAETATTTAISVGPNANTPTTDRDMSTLAADGIVHSAHRTPHSARFPRPPGDDEEEVLIGLLSGSRQQPGDGVTSMAVLEEEGDEVVDEKTASGPMSAKDKYAIALLIVLYLIQGIPIGLAFGSIPFLLKSKLSYSQLGTFSLCTFPYSLKLFHAPIVDAVFHPKLGRRKSWIVPIQIIMGSLMIWLANHTSTLIETEHPPVNYLTAVFTLLIFFAATQDIAVDGWALTLLSQENLSYASTAQTAGLNSGYFLSFTVFLALNSAEFANKYFRTVPSDIPMLSLGAYLRFWGLVSFAVSLWLLFFKKEDPVKGDGDDLHLVRVYKSMWEVCKLKHVQLLCAVHLIAKIGFQTNEAATNLKLVEKGLNKEDLALVVLVDFPFQIIGGWLAARWSVGDKALRPWIWGFWARLGFAVYYMAVLWIFPRPPIPASFFLLLIVSNVMSSFASTVQFVGMSAFHTQIADPLIGGTYMTLLNTISNLGGTWPRFFVLRGVDYFTVATCHGIDSSLAKGSALAAMGAECVSEAGKALCAESGGTCLIERDGYYIMSTICVGLAVVLLVTFILPTAKMLQALPLQKWRIKSMPH